MLNNKQLMSKYYNPRAVCQVLGGLMKNPQWVKSKDLPITADDFINPLHLTIFGVVLDLAEKGIMTIGLADIEAHLNQVSPVSYERFEKAQGQEWVSKVLEVSEVDNFEYYYHIVKKLTCLRSYLAQGISVSDLLDYTLVDPDELQKQEEAFFKMELTDIVAHFDKRLLKAKLPFANRDQEDCGVLGDVIDEVMASLGEAKPYGFTLESEYLNEVLRGGRRGTFYLEIRDSGMGKEFCPAS